jgi:hypothetical protein
MVVKGSRFSVMIVDSDDQVLCYVIVYLNDQNLFIILYYYNSFSPYV